MEIRTFDTVYTVIHKARNESGLYQYLCKNETDGALYQLFGRKREFIDKETIAFLNEQLNNKEFIDFKDLFVYEDQLIAVMSYHVAPTLQERFKKDLEFEERLEIGRGILEAFLLQKMPPHFRLQCLDMERILVTDSLEVQFAYSLEDMELACARKEEDVWVAFASLLEKMWKPELSRDIIPALKRYLEFLRSKERKTQESVYRNYLLMMETMKAMSKTERNQPNQRLLRIWKCIHRQIPRLCRIAAFLILLAALLLLGYSIWKQKQPTGTTEPLIRYIGTLELKE